MDIRSATQVIDIWLVNIQRFSADLTLSARIAGVICARNCAIDYLALIFI